MTFSNSFGDTEVPKEDNLSLYYDSLNRVISSYDPKVLVSSLNVIGTSEIDEVIAVVRDNLLSLHEVKEVNGEFVSVKEFFEARVSTKYPLKMKVREEFLDLHELMAKFFGESWEEDDGLCEILNNFPLYIFLGLKSETNLSKFENEHFLLNYSRVGDYTYISVLNKFNNEYSYIRDFILTSSDRDTDVAARELLNQLATPFEKLDDLTKASLYESGYVDNAVSLQSNLVPLIKDQKVVKIGGYFSKKDFRTELVDDDLLSTSSDHIMHKARELGTSNHYIFIESPDKSFEILYVVIENSVLLHEVPLFTLTLKENRNFESNKGNVFNKWSLENIDHLTFESMIKEEFMEGVVRLFKSLPSYLFDGILTNEMEIVSRQMLPNGEFLDNFFLLRYGKKYWLRVEVGFNNATQTYFLGYKGTYNKVTRMYHTIGMSPQKSEDYVKETNRWLDFHLSF